MFHEKNLPEDWTFEYIKDSCDLVMGQSPPGSSYNEYSDGMPFLQGKTEFGNTFPTHVKYTNKPLRKASHGSILMSVRAPIGDVNIANIDYCIGRGLASINLINGDNKYLFYLLNYLKPKIEESGTGSTFKAITKSGLEKIKIPVPPIETQKKIVEILEKAEKLKEWRVEADELADEFLKSVFLDMFGDPINNPKGWETKKGEDYCQKLSVGVVIKPASYYVDKGVIALRSLNIKPNRIDLNDLVYFSSDDHLDKLSKSILNEGDVVLVRTGVTGTAAVIPRELDGCNCIDLIIARPNVKIINSVYLAFFFNSENGKNLVLSKEVGGIQKHFNVKAIKNLEIPIPPIELQNQFAEIVKQVETLKTGQKQSKQQIDNLFNALMQKAFKGELTC